MNKKFAFSLIAISLTAISSNAENFKHRPLIEEYTGLWCQWCPRGHVAMEMIDEKYGADQVSISYHVTDAMSVTETFVVNVMGVPVGTVDRGPLIDPYYGETEREDFAISRNIEAAMALETPVDIQVGAELIGNKVNVRTTVTAAEDIDNANYQIGYVLTCSGLSNSSWRQMNEYSSYRGKDTFKGTPLEPLTEESVYIRGMVYNNVAVDVTGMRGVSGSLPASITAGETYQHTYSFNNIDRNALIQDPNRLEVAAFVINKSTGRIVNANKYSFYKAHGQDEENAVKEVIVDAEVVSTEYFDLNGTRVADPAKGIFICRQTLSDGTVRTQKVVRR